MVGIQVEILQDLSLTTSLQHSKLQSLSFVNFVAPSAVQLAVWSPGRFGKYAAGGDQGKPPLSTQTVANMPEARIIYFLTRD